MYYWYYDYGIFILQYTASNNGLTSINFINKFKKNSLEFNSLPFVDIHSFIESYVQKKPIDIDILLDFSPTPFQKKVYEHTSKISFGKVITYKDLAILIQNPKSARAVGGALGKNPFPILIPCHRIIGSTGKLTGFSAIDGIELKRKLLIFEKEE